MKTTMIENKDKSKVEDFVALYSKREDLLVVNVNMFYNMYSEKWVGVAHYYED